MKAIIVDDENACADYLESVCMLLPELDVRMKFSNALAALDYLRETPVDLVFLDIEMPGLTGIEAIHRMRELRPELAVIFVTGYEQYALEAFRADAVSYLLKPCDEKELYRAVEKAKRLMPAVPQVRVQAFGPFCLFLNGEAYHFSNAKARELLALLVNRRGAVVTMEQAADVLWEDRAYDEGVKQLYRKAVIALNQLNVQAGVEFFVSNRGSCHILPAKLDCDFYRLMEGDKEAVKHYNGEYMSQYSWAEETTAYLDRIVERG